MQQLLEIAEDYKKVKNYVYGRYGGIGSLFKIYPGYTVQNEMTKSGLRAELDMPSVYFYLAMFDAGRYQEPVDQDKVQGSQAGKSESESDSRGKALSSFFIEGQQCIRRSIK